MHDNTPSKPALLLTPQEAAEALAISPRKLWGMTASGEIPCVRLGRSVRYPVNDLQRWIDHQTKGGESR
jgi:excisionase family DNA binding protein